MTDSRSATPPQTEFLLLRHTPNADAVTGHPRSIVPSWVSFLPLLSCVAYLRLHLRGQEEAIPNHHKAKGVDALPSRPKLLRNRNISINSYHVSSFDFRYPFVSLCAIYIKQFVRPDICRQKTDARRTFRTSQASLSRTLWGGVYKKLRFYIPLPFGAASDMSGLTMAQKEVFAA